MSDSSVLLVEDSDSDALLIKVHLRSDTRFSVTHVDSLADACEALCNDNGINVVILDLNLPDSLGLETFSRLHERFPATPVVILSGHDDEEVAIEAVRLGAQDYVPKGSVDAPLLVRSLLYAMERNGRQLAERRNLMVDRELATARQIQQHLLPSQPPSIDGFDIAAVCQPAAACGGDFFDFIPIAKRVSDSSAESGTTPSGTDAGQAVAWEMLVADVSSHGFAPALIMVGTRRMLRTCVQIHEDIARCLSIANQAVNEDTLDSQFVTMFLCRLDPDCRTLTYSGAGHEAHILHASRDVTTLESSGLPLGLVPDFTYAMGGAVKLGPGDIVFLMTDGAVEAKSPNGEFFGQQRVLDLIHEHRELPAADIVGLLLKAITEFCEPASLMDDVTLLVMKVLDADDAA